MVRSILTRCSGTFSLQVNDVQEMLECLSVEEEGMWSCIGSSGHTSSGVAGGLVDDDIEMTMTEKTPLYQAASSSPLCEPMMIIEQ